MSAPRILDVLGGCGTVTAADAARVLGCSRQYAQRLLHQAVDDGDAVRSETGPGLTATYRLVDRTPVIETARTLPTAPQLPEGIEGIRGVLRNSADVADVIERRLRSTGVVTERDVAAIEWMAAGVLRAVEQARAVTATAVAA